jgi:tetratricopeptide (TPR) repeat protein
VIRRHERAIAAGVLALFACAGGPSARAAVDHGVIRIQQANPPTAADTTSTEPAPRPDSRHSFDVEAFDSRFESLWFQRKAYQADGRDEDAARQSDLIRNFVSEEGVRRLEIPAAALLLEARTRLREGSHDKALAALALAESLDPGRPQIALARAHVLWAKGAGPLAAGAEWLRAVRGTIQLAFRDLNLLHATGLIALAAVLAGIALYSVFMVFRYQVPLRHDVEEWLNRSDKGVWAKAGGWAALLLPFVLWVGAGWAAIYWIVLLYRYMRRSERVLAAVLLVVTALAVPVYRISVGLYGLTADPTIRTTIEAANGGYDPDRIVKLRELVATHPDDPMYRFLLAGLYKNGRYFDEAFQEYKRVLEAAPATYQARINMGNIYFVLGQCGEAVSNYRKALDIRPKSALAYYDMYLAQSDSFKLQEASDSLAAARDIDSSAVNAWLAAGSGEGRGPKAIDAVIDFGSIWRATVEGRNLKEWFEAEPAQGHWGSTLADVANPTSVLALAALITCGVTLMLFRGRQPARRCARCGQPFCSYCKFSRDDHDYCNPCVHLFVLGEGLAPETKSMKLYEVERHEARGRKGRRISAALLPGAAHLMLGRAWLGCGLLMLWLLAWIGGYPQGVARIERILGFSVHLAGLRPQAIPDVYGLDAVLLLAIPLGIGVWLAGNVAFSRTRRV